MTDKQIFNKTEYLKEYAKQDSRLQKANVFKELVANNNGINFERLMNIGKGVREIHEITIYGGTVPMRVLSMKEERFCRQQTYVGMKQFPEFPPDSNDYTAEFNKMLLRKMISLSTSPCPEFPHDNERFFTEQDLEAMPALTFAELVNKYRALELEYNPEVNQLTEHEINTLIGELRDPAKKFVLLRGMTLSQLLAVTSRLLEMENVHEDNIHLLNSLNDTNLTKITELI